MHERCFKNKICCIDWKQSVLKNTHCFAAFVSGRTPHTMNIVREGFCLLCIQKNKKVILKIRKIITDTNHIIQLLFQLQLEYSNKNLIHEIHNRNLNLLNYMSMILIITHFFRASIKLIRASGFTGSCKQTWREMFICVIRTKTLRNFRSGNKLLTSLGFNRAGRNRVKKYGLLKILWKQQRESLMQF